MLRVLFALCFLLVGEARGQGLEPDDLNFRGLKLATIYVDPLDQDSKDCGLKEEALEAAVSLPINAYTKLRIEPWASSKELDAPVIVISVNTVKNRTWCIFAYSVEVQRFMKVKTQ